MPIRQMEAVAETQMVKAILPFAVAGILAVVGWLFQTVMQLENILTAERARVDTDPIQL